jgi:HlyD family secretion protein
MDESPFAPDGDALSRALQYTASAPAAPRRRSRAVRIVLTALGAGLVLWAVYVGLTWDLRDKADPSARFEIVPVERGNLERAVVATGFVEPETRVIVQSEIPGIVAVVHVDDGDRVAAGQPIVELDRERLERQVAEARARLERFRALAAQPLVERSRVALAQAEREDRRVEALASRGVESRRSLDTTRDRVDLARLELTNARDATAARAAAVAEAEQNLLRFERDLGKTVIRSPVDGVVVDRKVDKGSAVADIQNGGTVVAELAADRAVHVLGDVDENDIADVRVGQPARVSVDALPGEVLDGVVRKVAAAGTSDTATVVFQVEIELAPDPRVRVGMSADARIVVAEHENVLLVPTAAVLHGDGPARVRRPVGDDAEEFEEVKIEEGYSDGFRTIVSSGLEPGSRVLVRSGADPG